MKRQKTVGLIITLALLVATLAGSAGSALAAPAPRAGLSTATNGAGDEELVLLQGNGRIHVEDPYVAPGTQRVEFDSPDTGWQVVRAGDFNGDGDQELVAIGGGRLKVFDPVVPAGSVACELVKNVSPYKWELVATGDIDNDGRDEIMAVRTAAGDKHLLLVYNGNETGRSWTEQLRVDYNYAWRDIAPGDFVNDGRVELAMIRDFGNLVHIINPQTGAVVVSEGFGKEWRGITTGDYNNDGKDELAVIRNVISPTGAGFVILRVQGVGLPLDAIYTEEFGAYWLTVKSGDLDGATNDEVLLLRNVPSPYKGLIARDLRTPTVTLNAVVGTGWQDMATGDLDGDGADEVIIQSPSLVRAYRVSPTTTYKSYSGSWRDGFTTADLDGTGVTVNPTMQISPTTLNFEMDYEGPNPAPKTVLIKNVTSTDAFEWTATPKQPWVMVSPSSGTADATGTQVTISIDGSALPAGTSTTRVIFEATSPNVGGSPARLTVNVTVRRPTLVVIPDSIEVTASVGDTIWNRQIAVGHTGTETGNLNWMAAVIPAIEWDRMLQQMERAPLTEIDVTPQGMRSDLDGLIFEQESVDWLTVVPSEGVTPSIVVVGFDTTSLDPGIHLATIVFDSGRGAEPEDRFRWVDVTLTLRPMPSAWQYLPLTLVQKP